MFHFPHRSAKETSLVSPSWRQKLTFRAVPVLAFSALFATLGVVNPASAATAPSVSVTRVVALTEAAVSVGHTTAFCQEASKVQQSTPLSAETSSANSLASDYKQLKADEPKILSIVPSQLKGDYQELFNYFNSFYAELASVKFSFTKLSPTYLAKFALSASKLSGASKAIAAYVEKNCGITISGAAG